MQPYITTDCTAYLTPKDEGRKTKNDRNGHVCDHNLTKKNRDCTIKTVL